MNGKLFTGKIRFTCKIVISSVIVFVKLAYDIPGRNFSTFYVNIVTINLR